MTIVDGREGDIVGRREHRRCGGQDDQPRRTCARSPTAVFAETGGGQIRRRDDGGAPVGAARACENAWSTGAKPRDGSRIRRLEAAAWSSTCPRRRTAGVCVRGRASWDAASPPVSGRRHIVSVGLYVSFDERGRGHALPSRVAIWIDVTLMSRMLTLSLDGTTVVCETSSSRS